MTSTATTLSSALSAWPFVARRDFNIPFSGTGGYADSISKSRRVVSVFPFLRPDERFVEPRFELRNGHVAEDLGLLPVRFIDPFLQVWKAREDAALK